MPFRTITDVSARVSFGFPIGVATRGFAFTGANIFFAAACCTCCDTGLASRTTQSTTSATSSSAANAEATSVAVRHGVRISGSEWSTAA